MSSAKSSGLFIPGGYQRPREDRGHALPVAAKKIPADARGLHGLMKRFDEKGPESVYLLVGDDRKDVEAAIEYITEKLVDPDLAPLNSASLRGTDVIGDEIVAGCSTFSMMADRRLIILRELERLTAGQDELVAYLENPGRRGAIRTTCRPSQVR